MGAALRDEPGEREDHLPHVRLAVPARDRVLAEDLSSDTILVGSDAPLEFDVSHLRRGLAEPGVAAELERAYVHSPLDVLARVLLAGRGEVMEYTQIEERLRDGRWRPLPASTNREPCPPRSCRRTPAPINTDDNALIEFAAPRDLIGFERYKGYLRTIYADGWPYGHVSERVTGAGSGARASEQYAELSLALLAHGRKREAGAALARAATAGPSGMLELARGVYEALGDRPVEPSLRVPPPGTDAAISGRANQRVAQAHAEVTDWLARGQLQRAKAAIDGLPASLVRHGGPPMRYLRAYVLQRTGDHESAVGELESLARTEPAFVHERPELYFFLGRSHYALLHFDKAVRAVRAYVESARSAGGAEALPEPDVQTAPVSDAPGEAEKAFQGQASPG